MDIESLEMFCLVVEEGSISQAAKKSYLSQPAATRRIHQLEDAYGTLLFERTDRKLIISKAGEVLYPIARAIVKDYQRSKEAIRQLTEDMPIHLKIGASLTIGEYLLPELLGRFKQQYTDIQITLEIGNTPNILENLLNDEIDLALVEGVVDNKDLNIKKFADDELTLVCSANHRWKERDEIDIRELPQERMIWREEHSGTRAIVEAVLEEHGVLDQIESYMELGSTQAIKGAVEANLGISILSEMATARELKQNTLHKINISGVNLKRGLWMVQKSQRFHQAGVEKFIRFLDELELS